MTPISKIPTNCNLENANEQRQPIAEIELCEGDFQNQSENLNLEITGKCCMILIKESVVVISLELLYSIKV